MLCSNDVHLGTSITSERLLHALVFVRSGFPGRKVGCTTKKKGQPNRNGSRRSTYSASLYLYAVLSHYEDGVQRAGIH